MTDSTPRPLDSETIGELRNALSNIATFRDELRAQLQEAVNEVGAAWDSVDESATCVEERTQKLNDKEATITELAAKVHQAAEQHSKNRSELAAERQKAAELAELLQATTDERDSDRTRLESALTELESLTDLLDVLQATQEELDRTRSELQALQETDTESGDDTLSQLVELKTAKELLDAELAQQTAKVQQLTDTVDRQTKELTILRKRWSEDLGSMRDGMRPVPANASETTVSSPPSPPQPAAFEQVSDAAAVTPSENSQRSMAAVSDQATTVAPVDKSDDPVLGSVLDEFNALQETSSE